MSGKDRKHRRVRGRHEGFSGATRLALLVLWLTGSSGTTHAQERGSIDADEVMPSIEIGPGGRLEIESDARATAEAEYPGHVHTMLESRYVTEGRDNLDGEGLISVASDLSFGDFVFAPWLAHGLSSDYVELNLNFAYAVWREERFKLFASYTHLRFSPDESPHYDNEVGVEAVAAWLEPVELTFNGYYSFDAQGSFFEVALNLDQEIGPRSTASVQAALGFNAGYITDGHDGANNVRLRLDLAYRPFPRAEVIAYLAFSKAIDRQRSRFPGDEALKDMGWGGVGLTYSF